ncbi:MAG: hypothetical protein E7813_10150 [Bradyrhizobium sp.]|uniref:hypothetical protein n=1 Tax=Bradyrhizobium sp. TaxID=376 RepID=UPI001222E1BB|nr:hypothetical protein [Bradyrhizobium sp.]THD68598.1 MAG: hypothetical protein E7813_10150 [Bradyrhizobium sp.]
MVPLAAESAPVMWKRNLEVYEAAVRLATSGKMRGWESIREKLVQKGYRRVPDLLQGDKIRTVLDICCKAARDKKTEG